MYAKAYSRMHMTIVHCPLFKYCYIVTLKLIFSVVQQITLFLRIFCNNQLEKMSEDSGFSKQTLGQIAASKKNTTVEAAFDSDESDWSDEDGGGEEISVVKQNITGYGRGSQYLDKNGENQQSNAALQRNTTSSPEITRKNSVPRDLPLSPYVISQEDARESSLTQHAKLEAKSDAPSSVKANVFLTQKNVEEDDDWDDESCLVNNVTTTITTNQHPIRTNDKNALFQQPMSSAIKSHVGASSSTTTIKKRSTVVDWSETYSEGGSGSDNVDEMENTHLPQDNVVSIPGDPFNVARSTLEKHESIETVEENIDAVSIEDNAYQHDETRESTPHSVSSSMKDTPDDTSATPLPAVTPTPSKRDQDRVSDNYSNNEDNDRSNVFPKQMSHATLPPSTSSAANLFMVPPSLSPQEPIPANLSKSTFDLSESNPHLAESSKQKKKSKPTSAKKLLSRFFSSDDDKGSKYSKETTQQLPLASARKTSEPMPLSTLLLNTPLAATRNFKSDTTRVNQNLPSPSRPPTTTPLIPTRYFPSPPEPSSSAMQDNVLQQSGDVPGSKRKGFFGKMKRTLGISSKSGSSKMRASASLKNLSVTATTVPVSSDPCISSEQHQNRDQRVISVYTKGRPTDEVIADLFREGKRYLDTTQQQRSPSNAAGQGSGDTLASSNKMEQRTSGLGYLKRFSSAGQLLSPSTSKITMSETSLVDPAEAETGIQKMPHYCSQAIEHAPNRQIIYNLIEDFCCVLDKSFGEQDQLQSENGNLFVQTDQLRKALENGEANRAELERQIHELQCELQKLQFCLEEQCQARENLEGLVCELKAQIDRQDDLLNCLVAEKSDLVCRIKQLETEIWNLKNQVTDFGAEREEFSKNYKGFEGTRNKCSELQMALAECCEKHDLLQKEILEMRKENNEIKLTLDKVIFEKNKEVNNTFSEVLDLRKENNQLRLKLDENDFEKNKLANEMDALKQTWAQEKAGFESKICELLNGIAALEKTKGEVCRQTNNILAAHHEEMDNLKSESETYKAKYEEEAKIREDLERRLRSASNTPDPSPFRPSTSPPTSSSVSPPVYGGTFRSSPPGGLSPSTTSARYAKSGAKKI